VGGFASELCPIGGCSISHVEAKVSVLRMLFSVPH
jgi:hypothetical protein